MNEDIFKSKLTLIDYSNLFKTHHYTQYHHQVETTITIKHN